MGDVLGQHQKAPKDLPSGKWEVKLEQVEVRTETERRGLKDIGLMVLKMDKGARISG